MGAASRPVWVSGLLALLVAGCVTPAPVAVDSRPQVTATRRGHGVIVIAGARTHYFENYHPHCLAYTLPGEWEFGIQEGMLRGVGGRRLLVGAMITSAEHLPGAPGADGVSRVVAALQRDAEKDWDQPVASTVTSFPGARSGVVLLEFDNVVMTPRAAARTYGPAEAGKVVGLPKRVIVPFVDGLVLVLTVSEVEHARDVLSTLEVTEDPRCWGPTIRQRFPNIRWRQ